MNRRFATLAALFLAAALFATPSLAQEVQDGDALFNLDFEAADLPEVIDTMARLTGKNFVYDDRVRGTVTIISPTPVTADQAYAVFESVLQVKGFTTVETPGGVIKVIPIRDAKETNIDTRDEAFGTPQSDRFVTRLIPLSYIDASAIASTIRPLVGKEASLVAYGPTNTLILTDSASNIRRILSILEAIDVEIYKEELALISLDHADAGTLGTQLSEVFGGQVTTTAQPARARNRRRAQAQAPTPAGGSRGQVRILTDERTNSLIVLAARSTLADIRRFVRKLDLPVEGGGRIQVHYLKHADAEELADTLNTLLSGQSAGRGAGDAATRNPNQLRASVTELASGVDSVTADPATNALVIQASPEGFEALVRVIGELDIPRPQVLVEALIMEVDVTDTQQLGFNAVFRLFNGDTDWAFQTLTSAAGIPTPGTIGTIVGSSTDSDNILGTIIKDTSEGGTENGSTIQAVIRAAANDNHINILSAPHILTSDNEEAEISVGDNIPIITSRVQSAGGVAGAAGDLATSVNVERQDIGVTLRVTPQISEGETLRMQIFQEITDINTALVTGDINEVGVALSNRRIDNTVVVNDGDTVVVGGLISDNYTDSETKVPFLGDIPVLGWAFKSTDTTLTKRNLLVFLTPTVIRGPSDLEGKSIRKREEFRKRSEQAIGENDEKREQTIPDDEISILIGEGNNPTRNAVEGLERRYPLERLQEIEDKARNAPTPGAAILGDDGVNYSVVAAVYRDPDLAQELLLELVDAGFDGVLNSGEVDGAPLYEVRIGPYGDLATARKRVARLRNAYDLEARILLETEPEAEPEPSSESEPLLEPDPEEMLEGDIVEPEVLEPEAGEAPVDAVEEETP